MSLFDFTIFQTVHLYSEENMCTRLDKNLSVKICKECVLSAFWHQTECTFH